MFSKSLRIFCGGVILFLLLQLFSAGDNYITLKVMSIVMLSLAFLFIVLLSLIVLRSNYRYKRFAEKHIHTILSYQPNYQVELNGDTVKITTGVVLHEYCWTDFKAFGINGDTIIIFNPSESLMSFFWSKEETGEDIFQFVADTLKNKGIVQSF